MENKTKDLLAHYLNITPAELDKYIELREKLMTIEHNFYSQKSPDNFKFYQESSFLIFSHYQDEVERDQDVDWDDMVKSLKDAGFESFNKVLDFGCGIGSAGLNLEKRMPCEQVNFYEPNNKSTKFITCRYWMQSHNKKVIWDKENIFEEKYDLIIAWGVFEHLDDVTAIRIFVDMLESLESTGKIFLKNFYSDTDDYRFHFKKGKRITDLFRRFDHKIIYANHSDK